MEGPKTPVVVENKLILAERAVSKRIPETQTYSNKRPRNDSGSKILAYREEINDYSPLPTQNTLQGPKKAADGASSAQKGTQGNPSKDQQQTPGSTLRESQELYSPLEELHVKLQQFQYHMELKLAAYDTQLRQHAKAESDGKSRAQEQASQIRQLQVALTAKDAKEEAHIKELQELRSQVTKLQRHLDAPKASTTAENTPSQQTPQGTKQWKARSSPLRTPQPLENNDATQPSRTPRPTQAQRPEQTTYADLASLLATKPRGEAWQTVTKKSRKQGVGIKPAKKSPTEARRFLLHKRAGDQPAVAKESIVLAINTLLTRLQLPGFLRAANVSETKRGNLSVLLGIGSLTSMIFPQYEQDILQAVRAVDPLITNIEEPKQWYRVKVHGVSINRYKSLGLDTARLEIETGSELRLTRTPTWLVNPSYLGKDSRKGSTIVITVDSLEQAKRICAKGIYFGGNRHTADLFYSTGPDAVCPRCSRLGHQSFKDCGGNPLRCTICAGPHEISEHTCGSNTCLEKKSTPCAHMPAKCANCGGAHQATAVHCKARKEARLLARKAQHPPGFSVEVPPVRNLGDSQNPTLQDPSEEGEIPSETMELDLSSDYSVFDTPKNARLLSQFTQ